MGKIVVDMTMSLDGFVTGPNDGPGKGLGEGGEVLMEWVFSGRTEGDEQVLGEGADTIGAAILGRRTFDIAEKAWGENPPFVGPVFVLTKRPHATITRGAATFTFVTEGLESALSQARAAADGKDIELMGPSVSQQFLEAGLVDEINIHLANALLGAGRPLFDNAGEKPARLERTRVIATPRATHLKYLVVR